LPQGILRRLINYTAVVRGARLQLAEVIAIWRDCCQKRDPLHVNQNPEGTLMSIDHLPPAVMEKLRICGGSVLAVRQDFQQEGSLLDLSTNRLPGQVEWISRKTARVVNDATQVSEMKQSYGLFD
jgi:hypothetical protein